MKTLLIYSIVFLIGSALVLVPAFYQASLINAYESARGEQTMSPGIHLFFGMIFAPVGGIVAMAALLLFRYSKRQQPRDL